MEKLKGLEELVVQTPLLPEPDPAVAQMAQNIPLIQNSIDSLSKEVQSLKKLVQTLPTEFPEPVVIEKKDPKLVSDRSPNNVESDPLSDDSKLTKEEEDIEEEIIESDPAEETIVESSVETESFGQDTEESSGEVEIELEGQNEDEMEPPTPPNPALESSPEGQDQTIEDELDTNDETATPEKSQPSEESPDNTDVQEEPVIEELALELPDPAETLRKVDAILQETDPSDSSGSSISSLENKEISVPKTSSTGTTSVVANVMIGIGNKPYLRGEGPGLNWDEGVPMNFIEIGKWAWSPSRKNASLTVQLYRNDNDPDQSGKIEVKAGEKIEITPQFG